MDASTLSSEETQATQIINFVLPQHSVLESRVERHTAARQEQIHDGSNRLESSSSSSQNGSTAQYHYFGLASTQTDSQVDGVLVSGGSQKENVHASGSVDSALSHSSVLSRPLDPNRRAEQDATEDVDLDAVSRLRPSRVTFKSPIPSPHVLPHRTDNVGRVGAVPGRDGSRPLRRRSPSPASQDSFAGPLPPEEAEKLFVASTTAFNIPLSELQQSNTDDLSAPQTPSSIRSPSAYSFPGVERRVPLPAPPRPLKHTGEILVAETPSNSSRSSNCQSVAFQTVSQLVQESPSITRQMRGGDTQLAGEFQPHAEPRGPLFGVANQETPNASTRPSSPVDDVSTEPSSSYERVLGADLYAPNSQAYAAAQSATQIEATQLADATEDAGTSLDTGASHFDPFNPMDRQFPAELSEPSIATTTTNRKTVGRSLAGLIPVHRRWQYQVEGVGPSTKPIRSVPGDAPPAVQRMHAQETQPSDTNAVNGSATTDVPHAPLAPRRRPPSSAANQDVDVVPDSEPMDVDTPGPDTEAADNPPSKRVSRLRLDSPVEEVPDSVVTDRTDSGDDGEEEVPLAVQSIKGKGKVQAKVPRPGGSPVKSPRKSAHDHSDKSKVRTDEPAKVASNNVKALKKGRIFQDHSRETSAAPSSKTSEETTSSATTRATRPGGSKRDQNSSTTRGRGQQSRSKPRSMTPASALKQRRASTGSSDDATAVSKDTELLLPGACNEGDTELADDDYMDVDEEAPRSKARSAKRKRVNSVPSKGASSRAASRSTKKSNTPIGSAAKKRKVSSSTVTDNESSATRVFALWRQDNHYYSGIVHSMSSTTPPRYLIYFDDGTEDVVEVTKMRLCKLMKDDQVLVPGKQKAVVVDVSRFDSDRVVTVEIDNGEELEQLEVDVGDIKIASRTLASAWNNRTLVAEEVCPIVRPNALKNSPSPSKLTLGSAGSLKSVRRVLGKTGFVVTMSPKNEHWEKTKEKVMQAIKGNGGIVIDNWTDIFAMDGTYSQGGKRWVVRYEDIRCIVRRDIEQVFLLSDDCNAKPKYLIALALGIPCLDYSWILNTVGGRQEQDWQQYLLPAGLCEYLNARVSQFVDLDWGNSSEHLHAITENKVASKVFTAKRILCISPDYVPIAKARKNSSDAEKAKEASRMVPRIILTMGASSVEAVMEARYASSKDLSEYDYVVVKDSGDVGRVASGANCVPFGWVKDCLIAGRLLPQPND